MTTDRHEQARAEAERRVATKRERLWDTEGEHLSHTWGAGFQAGFREAAEWADANPKPHTITEYELNEASMAIADLLPARLRPAYVLIETALRTLGIEVEDDDE